MERSLSGKSNIEWYQEWRSFCDEDDVDDNNAPSVIESLVHSWKVGDITGMGFKTKYSMLMTSLSNNRIMPLADSSSDHNGV